LSPQLQALNYGAATVIVAAHAFQMKVGAVDTQCLQHSWASYLKSGKAAQVKEEIHGVSHELASPAFKWSFMGIILRNQITGDQDGGGLEPQGPSSVE